MTIEQVNNDEKGYFKAMDSDTQAGLMTYTWRGGDRFTIDHTEVHKPFLGMGIGEKMVMKAVEFARKNNVKIVPLCPFAKSVFEKTPEIRDVL